MDWIALQVSLTLALSTSVILLPLGIAIGRALATQQLPCRPLIQSLIFLPLVLPPTVLGYYFLVFISPDAFLGRFWQGLMGRPLVFSFEALLLVSLVANLPFAIQPIHNSFASIDSDIRDAARVCGLTVWQALWRVELPLAWPGILSAFLLTFTHTLGEFGVVLMVGGNLVGETRTLSIAIYDEVQTLNFSAAGQMSLFLLVFALISLFVVQWYTQRTLDKRFS